MIGDNDIAPRFRALDRRIDKVPDRTRPLEIAHGRKARVLEALMEAIRLQVVVEIDGADFRHLAKEDEVVFEARLGELGGAMVDPAGSVRVYVG